MRKPGVVFLLVLLLAASGCSPQATPMPPTLTVTPLPTRTATPLPSFTPTPTFTATATPTATWAFIPAGKIITHRLPLSEAPRAYQMLDQAPEEAIQVVFEY